MSFLRPEIGEVTLLVYRECACGWWCATGEGAVAPICPSCGRSAMPLGGGKGQFVHGDGKSGRYHRGLGFVAFFTNEMRAVSLIGKVKQFLGISPATNPHLSVPMERGPYATESEITSQLDDREMPIEPLWESMPPWYPEPSDPDYPGGRWTDSGADEIRDTDPFREIEA